jgi:hypothetical protein
MRKWYVRMTEADALLSLMRQGTIRVEGLCSMAAKRRRLGKRRREEEGNVSLPHRY